MIHSFKVKNYRSILDEQVLDFTTSKKIDSSVSYSEITKKYVNNIALLTGANGSGKTSLLNAFVFFSLLIQLSDAQPIGELYHIKHKLALNSPTNFELIFEINNKLYKLVIELNKTNEISKEILYVKDTSRYSYIYKILASKDIDINPKKKMDADIRKRLYKEFELFKNKRTKATLIANLIRYESSENLLGIKKIFDSYCTNIAPFYLEQKNKPIKVVECSEILKQNEGLLRKIISYIKKIDHEIIDINFKGDTKYKIENKTQEEDVLNFVHRSKNQQFNIDFLQESEGTCSFVEKIIWFLNVLENGGIAVVDEIDNSLHPLLLIKLVELFSNKEINKNGAQLIFTTHQPLLLQERTKEQIYLAEKQNLSTEIYRLDEIIGIKNNENFSKKYLSGEYGAVPNLGVF